MELNGLVMAADWSRKFDQPIPLSRGRKLVTLRDAGRYITKLPKAEQATPEWQTATQALMLVANHGGPTMLARMGIMKALNRDQADIEDRAADNRAVAGLFARGTAGAAGIDMFLQTRKAAAARLKEQQAEAEASRTQERTRRFVDDDMVWRAATADVQPLRRR